MLDEAKMMCCCISSLVQAHDNNANVIHARLNYGGISMIDGVLWNSLYDSTQGVT